MAYEDVTLLTSDSVKIKAYVIPARRNIKSREEIMGMSPAERDVLGKEAMEEWVKEMGEDETIEVCQPVPSYSQRMTFLVGQGGSADSASMRNRDLQ